MKAATLDHKDQQLPIKMLDAQIQGPFYLASSKQSKTRKSTLKCLSGIRNPLKKSKTSAQLNSYPLIDKLTA